MLFSAFAWYAEHVLRTPGGEGSVEPEEQNSDYESGVATIDGHRWRVRTARVTQAKPGAFVAVWRRSEVGGTEPFPADDDVAGLLVFVAAGEPRGVFRFTPEHLAALGITHSHAHPGKRGFRVYPPWCTNLNAQATRTQTAQARAFVTLTPR